jgi:hypothetical protein
VAVALPHLPDIDRYQDKAKAGDRRHHQYRPRPGQRAVEYGFVERLAVGDQRADEGDHRHAVSQPFP